MLVHETYCFDKLIIKDEVQFFCPLKTLKDIARLISPFIYVIFYIVTRYCHIGKKKELFNVDFFSFVCKMYTI